MYSNKSVAVVIPMYNEESRIGKVIETMPDYVDKIVIVDDCSRDKSAEIVGSYGIRFPGRIVLLKTQQNSGCGGALAQGYEWARQNDMDIAVRMDGDGQMSPEDLRLIIDPVFTGRADYAKGNRLSSGEAYRKIPKIRYYGNAILSLLTKIASGYWHMADSQSGFTAMNKNVLHTIDWTKMYKRFGQPNDLLVRLNVSNFRVADVPVKPLYNIGEKSKMSVPFIVIPISWLLLKLFFWRLKEKYVIRDFHPLVFFYLLGLALLAASVALGVRMFVMWFISGHIPPINALAFMFSFAIGFQSLFFAMWFDMQYNRDLRPMFKV